MMNGFLKSFDYISFLATIFLIALGLLIIYSISLGKDVTTQENIFVKQLVFSLVSLVCYFIFVFIDYRNLKNISFIIYGVSLALLVFTYLLGLETRGSTRWIDLGFFRIQPSEFMKLGLILYLSSYLSSRPAFDLKNIIVPIVATLIPVVMILTQPDLGSALVLATISLALIFSAGLKIRYLLIFMVAVLVSLPLTYSSLQDYQKRRVETFLNPSSDPLKSGYNVIQSIIAVGSGQITGKGFGRGTQSHLNFLPEKHTDFIFATLSEELGLVGASLLLALMAVLSFRLVGLASSSTDPFATLIIIGVLVQLLSQFFVNVGMNIGLLPVTGITLPLISYGGSSLLGILISLGIIQSTKRYTQV